MSHPDYPRVEVEWEDSSSSYGWKPLRVHTHRPKTPMRSTGYLLVDDKRGVVLAQSLSGVSDEVGDSIAIPRGCIRKVRRLR